MTETAHKTVLGFYFRGLKIRGIDAEFLTSIMLFSNRLKLNSKIVFSRMPTQCSTTSSKSFAQSKSFASKSFAQVKVLPF